MHCDVRGGGATSSYLVVEFFAGQLSILLSFHNVSMMQEEERKE